MRLGSFRFVVGTVVALIALSAWVEWGKFNLISREPKFVQVLPPQWKPGTDQDDRLPRAPEGGLVVVIAGVVAREVVFSPGETGSPLTLYSLHVDQVVLGEPEATIKLGVRRALYFDGERVLMSGSAVNLGPHFMIGDQVLVAAVKNPGMSGHWNSPGLYEPFFTRYLAEDIENREQRPKSFDRLDIDQESLQLATEARDIDAVHRAQVRFEFEEEYSLQEFLGAIRDHYARLELLD